MSHACLIDAAFGQECFDGSGDDNLTAMRPAAWQDYIEAFEALWAAHWHERFDTNDARSTLTWRNRFTDAISEVYSFYSSTEDVLAEYDGEVPTTSLGALGVIILNSGSLYSYVWVYQEKAKGNRQDYYLPVPGSFHAGSRYGGWGVMPYGKGMKKDLIFTVRSKEVKDAGNFDAQGDLTFANLLDGLHETTVPEVGKNSAFRWERLAPENGYQPKFQLQNTWRKDLHQKPIRSFKFGGKEWEGYFFRVRTVEHNGQIVSAHYGKIRGGIEIEPRETPTCTIIFTYYYNPTPNDRNLEWDTKKNLFGNLKDLESPREP